MHTVTAMPLLLAAETAWALALITTVVFSIYAASQDGFDINICVRASLGAVVGGIITGRLWCCLFTPEAAGSSQWLFWVDGHKSIMGVILGAALGVCCALAPDWQRFSRYFDAVLPAACTGYMIARCGCLLAGCCFGTPTSLPWGVRYVRQSSAFWSQLHCGLIPPDAAWSLPVHPAAAYEAVVALLLWRLCSGQRGGAAIALTGYGAARFGLEFLRGDATVTWLGLSVAQLGSLVFMLVGVALYQAIRQVPHDTAEAA